MVLARRAASDVRTPIPKRSGTAIVTPMLSNALFPAHRQIYPANQTPSSRAVRHGSCLFFRYDLLMFRVLACITVHGTLSFMRVQMFRPLLRHSTTL